MSGEGATTTPGIMTSHWATTKGRCESDLLALSNSTEYANLRPISLRPGGVDPGKHPEIQQYLPKKGAIEKAAFAVLMPALRGLVPSMMSPTKDLGRVLTDLAMGDGEAFSEKDAGISGEGRTLANVAMRRIAGI